MSGRVPDELRDLIEGVCNETLSQEDSDRLSVLLSESEEARRTYLDYLGIHARLSWEFGPRSAAAPRWHGRILPFLGSAVAAGFLLAVLAFLLHQPPSEAPKPAQNGLRWNEGRLESVDVWPAPGALAIDGDLSDWPSGRRFQSRCGPPDSEIRWVEGSMAYDAKMLYLSARVGDPYPLRSRIDPRTDGASGWMGGAVQVRLSTDRSKPWPVQADHLEIRRRTNRDKKPEDAARSIVHLTMWYYAPLKESCLHLAYGMDFDGDRVNPEGYRGVIKPDPEGKGYVLEYAIPWALLSAGENPPRAGDTLAASWTVTWADESGRASVGQLVDILNRDRAETRWIFMRAGDWGKARYR